jgi:acyl carrier protein
MPALMNVRTEIVTQFTDVAREQGNRLAPLTDNLELLDTGLDSLCFAIIVSRLEEKLGADPFTSSDDVRFPVTFGDFVRLYENATR